MCGRFTLRSTPDELAAQFEIDACEPYAARYNIAPTQAVLAVMQADDRRVGHFLRWGLIPSWAKDPRIGSRMINARAETVAVKPSFRAAFRRRRCLIPADGYYEWTTSLNGKQAWYIHRPDDACFAFAGLWEHWEHDGTVIESCAILTCAANARLAAIHDRMPVVIVPTDYARWLACEPEAPTPTALLRAMDDDFFTLHRVTKRVNSPRHDGPDCIAPELDPAAGSSA
jgi:putative SOS response-associated peptidase YedK